MTDISQNNPNKNESENGYDRERDRAFAHDDMAVADLLSLFNRSGENMMGKILEVMDAKLKLELERNQIHYFALAAINSDDPKFIQETLEHIAGLTTK